MILVRNLNFFSFCVTLAWKGITVYYMAASRYEIFLSVLKKIFHEWAQLASKICFRHKKRNFVSPSSHVMFYLLYKHYFTKIAFCCKRHDLFMQLCQWWYFTCKDNMLFSYVKISCFHAKAHLVFHKCLYNKK